MSTTRGRVPLTDAQRDEAEKYLHLCGYVANRFARKYPRVARGEFLSAAFEGLADAVKSFDESRGVSLDCYAPPRIEGACLDMLRRDRGGVVRLPGRFARLDGKVYSLDAPRGEDARRFDYPAATPAPDARLAADERFEALLVGLTEVERLIVRKVYGPDGWSLARVAEHVGLSPSRVGQMHADAMGRIRQRAAREGMGRPSERVAPDARAVARREAARRKPAEPAGHRARRRTPPALPFGREELPRHLHRLEPRRRRVVELRYGLADGVERTPAEIGRIVGLAAPSVYHHLSSALGTLRGIHAGDEIAKGIR